MNVKTMSRRKSVAAVGALVLSARSTIVSAQSSLAPLKFGSTTLIDGVPAYRAATTGAFRAVGLDVTVEKMGSSSTIAAAIVGGAVDLGIVAGVPLINAHEHGVPLRVLYPNKVHVTGRPYGSAVIVAADSPIKSARDLNGKTMSCAAVKDSTWIAGRAFVDRNGGDSTTVNFVEVPFSAVVAALEAGRIQAGTITEPFYSQGVHSGRAKSLGDLLSGFGPRLLETTYATTAANLERNRDVLARFVRVVREQQEWCNAHRDEAAELALTFTGADRSALAPDTISFSTSSDPRELQPWIDACAKYGIIRKPFNAAELYPS